MDEGQRRRAASSNDRSAPRASAWTSSERTASSRTRTSRNAAAAADPAALKALSAQLHAGWRAAQVPQL